MPTSAVTVRRMRARYRREGVWGLVDHRATRPRSVLGRADERVVAALREVLEAGQERSSGTLGRLRMYTERLLAEQYGDGVVPLPSSAIEAPPSPHLVPRTRPAASQETPNTPFQTAHATPPMNPGITAEN
ncbi:hypothetical protein ACIOHC_40685 [Streptomyces sp. NPDC088252]|uniref:hypothetical protein n=1 Tax=unclassified Streptomyces TaxID=2593676 RepID=UPI003807D696